MTFKRRSYAETFERIAMFLLQQGKKKFSPLNFVLNDYEKQQFEWTTDIFKSVENKGWAISTVKELEDLYHNFPADSWPSALANLQRILGIKSNVIQQNIVSFSRVRRDETNKKKKNQKTNTFNRNGNKTTT